MNSGLQVYNEQNKLAQWAQTVAQCRDSGLSVRQWCQEHNVNVSSYYKWQRKVYARAQTQRESQFAEITPAERLCTDNVAVTLRLSGIEAYIHNGADLATAEMVLRILKPC